MRWWRYRGQGSRITENLTFSVRQVPYHFHQGVIHAIVSFWKRPIIIRVGFFHLWDVAFAPPGEQLSCLRDSPPTLAERDGDRPSAKRLGECICDQVFCQLPVADACQYSPETRVPAELVELGEAFLLAVDLHALVYVSAYRVSHLHSLAHLSLMFNQARLVTNLDDTDSERSALYGISSRTGGPWMVGRLHY